MEDFNYEPDATMKCPHCGVTVKLVGGSIIQTSGPRTAGVLSGRLPIRMEPQICPRLRFSLCPACRQVIIEMQARANPDDPYSEFNWLAYPRSTSRPPLHASVPPELAAEYREAAIVLSVSPKASAALSRRCLQMLLVKQGADPKKNLVQQIQHVYSKLPSYVQSFVDHIRELGNIAAHPMQDKATALILDVEPSEAEWMLELLEELLDHYYAKPAAAAAKQVALKAKLQNKTHLT